MILKRHHWPGNVRELENAIGHAAMMSAGPVIDASDLPQYLLQPAAGTEAETLSSPATIPSLADREKELVIEALKKSRANQSEAARILEISRDKLRYKMKKYGLV
jgi:DNA-binding NtrC family response regulator